MKYIIALLFFLLITFSSYGMFLFSTRARRAADSESRKKNRGFTNMSMGLMLAGIASIILLSDPVTTLRIIIACVFYALALFNFVSGIRNVRSIQS